jgi:putative membrane protein
MKNFATKIGTFAFAGLIAAGLQASAQDAPPPPAPATMSQPPSPTSADKMFVHKAVEGGMAEVKLGQLATVKASNPDVKAFGQKMVDDHTMLNDKMKPFADQLGVTVPHHLKAKYQATYDQLNALSGDDFDKAYVQAMVMDHRMDLREFRREVATTANSDLKDTVASAEKVISEHLTMVEGLAKEIGVTVPPSARRQGRTTPPPPAQ